MCFEVVERAVASCRRCSYVSKPYVEFGVYRMYMGRGIRVLVVSESPPPGNKSDFLYNLGHRDRLRATLAKFFGYSEEGLLEAMVDRGVFWDMAARCRPRSKRGVSSMARNCDSVAKLVLETLRPRRIVALGAVAREQVRRVLRSASLGSVEVFEDYHPLYVVRFKRSEAKQYFERLRELLEL
ncbi:MAG: hypothetical protein GXO32_04220 [Crenarchaeota archaeon]|nr:hypothetical protein [Thermoproteota archaeon]